MKKARDNGNFTRMVRDKVYIENNVYTLKVLEFSKLLSDIHCPISIFIDHVKQYQCMRSSSNSIADENRIAVGKLKYNFLFLENLDLELMIDLENSVNILSQKNISQAELDACIEKLGKLYINSTKTTFGTKKSRDIEEKKSKVSVSEKPWFGIDCKFVRQNHSQRKSRHKSK
jgi:hypothetical protein